MCRFIYRGNYVLIILYYLTRIKLVEFGKKYMYYTHVLSIMLYRKIYFNNKAYSLIEHL